MLFAAAPVARQGDLVILDDKFVSGMAVHRRGWRGPVHAVMRESAVPPPFGRSHDPASLDFDLTILPPDAAAADALRGEIGLVLASADAVDQLDLAQACRSRGIPVVFGIEYTLGTRLAVAMMDPSRGPLRRLWSAAWNLRQERGRRRALHCADGIQMNGFPADRSYRALNDCALRYLDNRMRADMMATPDDMAARGDRHCAKAPLRLIHSGRLEPMKGADLLVPLSQALDGLGLDYTLDIYGEGSLAPAIGQAIADGGGNGRLRLHPPLPFETGLVPASRREADLFVSLHTQSDPSCTYLEAMGCGLPVAGFANGMLRTLVAQSGGGWTAPMRDTAALARLIAGLDKDRAELSRAAQAGLSYAMRHDFDTEFTARMDHLAAVLDAASARRAARGRAGS